jgi:16S rRNA (uracil1498-N3)-methyltransferase
MRRFFIENDTIRGDIVELPESESRHISRVLRLKAGEAVELLDGRGAVYSAVLIETGKRVRARIALLRAEKAADSIRLTIGQGQLKGQKMDTVIQKCTELGVTRVAPFWSSRCQGKLNDLQGAKKLERYQRIVEAACKQCYRSDLMTVDSPREFQELLAAFPAGEGRLRLLFWEEEREATLHTVAIAEAIREVVVLLGPEGGLAADEVDRARSEGWRTVSLGRRILRAETATLTAASIVQFLLHNI